MLVTISEGFMQFSQTLLFIAIIKEVFEFREFIGICIVSLDVNGKVNFILFPVVDVSYLAVPVVSCSRQVKSLEFASCLIAVTLPSLFDNSEDCRISDCQ